MDKESDMSIVEESKAYVEKLFEKVDKKILSYHNWKHTMNVYNAANLIADNTEGLSDADKFNLKLATLFHDVGYLESPIDHEIRSAAIARQYLNDKDHPELKIEDVERLILATKLKYQPKDILEEIIIDADLSHLGRKDYLDTTYKFLSNEMSMNAKEELSDKDWAESCVSFITAHKFLTPFAKKKFRENKLNNLEKVKELIEEKINMETEGQAMAEEPAKEKKKGNKKEKKGGKEPDKNPLKGVETMFKIALRNHVDLSAIADKKANTLISVNAIIISIVLSALFPKLDSNPFLFYPSVTILIGCFITVFLAILSTIPNITRGEVHKKEVEEKRGNLLFFGNFHKMKLSDYEWSMQQLMESKDYIYGSMTRDLFFLGKVLNKKYTLLRFAYYCFLLGLLASITVFVLNVMPYIGSTSDLGLDNVGDLL